MSWVWGRQGQGQGPRRVRPGHDLRVLWSWIMCKVAGMWLLVEPTGDITWWCGSCAGPRYWGLMLEGGKHGAGVIPGMSVGMDRGAMPAVAMANTSECVAERSQLMAEQGQRLVAVAKPKAARQSGSLYDVVIQRIWPGIGPEGMLVIVGIQSQST